MANYPITRVLCKDGKIRGYHISPKSLKEKYKYKSTRRVSGFKSRIYKRKPLEEKSNHIRTGDVIVKGDRVRIKIQQRNGIVTSKWVSKKTFKKRYEAVYRYHDNRHALVFIPHAKIPAPRTGIKTDNLSTISGHKPIRVTLHIKIIYDKRTVERYLSSSREFYLEGSITTETYSDDLKQTVKDLESQLRERIANHFCKDDKDETFLSKDYYSIGSMKSAERSNRLNEDDYESGIEIKQLDKDDIPSPEINASAEYRYRRDSLLKRRDI